MVKKKDTCAHIPIGSPSIYTLYDGFLDLSQLGMVYHELGRTSNFQPHRELKSQGSYCILEQRHAYVIGVKKGFQQACLSQLASLFSRVTSFLAVVCLLESRMTSSHYLVYLYITRPSMMCVSIIRKPLTA